MKFPNGSGKRVNMMYPTDFSFWTKRKDFVDYEPVAAITPELRGVLASIGIVKADPFEPTARQRELLEKAVRVAPRMILAWRMQPRGMDYWIRLADVINREPIFVIASGFNPRNNYSAEALQF